MRKRRKTTGCERRQERQEAEERLKALMLETKEERKQEGEECKRERADNKALIAKQRQKSCVYYEVKSGH